MAQASLRLGKSFASQAIRRNLSTSRAAAGTHVNYSVQDGVGVLRFDVINILRIMHWSCYSGLIPLVQK